MNRPTSGDSSPEIDQGMVVPEDLLRQPGTKKDRREEAWFNFAHPETEWIRTPIGQTHSRILKTTPNRKDVYAVWDVKHKEMAEKFALLERTEPVVERPQHDMTAEIKAEAARIGFQVVGLTRFHHTYVYDNYRDQMKPYLSLIVAGLEDSREEFDSSVHSEHALADSHAHFYEISEMGVLLAEFLLAKGSRVQVLAGDAGYNRIKMLPYAEEAGLGQLGANGQLLSPYCGSRLKIFVLSTDARVEYDGPKDFGVKGLCEKCQICIRRCPGRALSKTPVHWRGSYRHKVDPARCAPMLIKFNQCNVCTEVCPVQKYGLPTVLEHYERTGGEILGKGTDELEAYSLPGKGHFGVGTMPRFTAKDALPSYVLGHDSSPQPDVIDREM